MIKMKKIMTLISIFALIGVTGCTPTIEYSTTEHIENGSSVLNDSKLAQNSSVISKDDTSSKLESSKDKSKWELDYYVDEFGDKTNEKYVKSTVIGSFSNTATDDSLLVVYMMIDSNYIAFKLYEYGDNLVKNSYSNSVSYAISTKNNDGEKKSFSGEMRAESGDRVIINTYSNDRFIGMLKNSEKIKFVVINEDRPSSVYNFELDCTGLDECYDKLNGINDISETS